MDPPFKVYPSDLSHLCLHRQHQPYCPTGDSGGYALYCSGERDEDYGQVLGACAALADAGAMEDPAWHEEEKWQPWMNDFPKCMKAETLSLETDVLYSSVVNWPNQRNKCDEFAEVCNVK